MKMICPKSETCTHRNDDGVGKHCESHEWMPACDFAGDRCPACVPVKEVKPKKEKR